MQWSCEYCGRTCVIPDKFVRVHCPCGAIVLRTGYVERPGGEDNANEDTVHVRKTICLFCPNYMGGARCVKISDGCRPAYFLKLHQLEPWCERWR